MAVTTVAYVADDTAWVQVKAAQVLAPFIQWMEGPPARIAIAAAQPAVNTPNFFTIGEAGFWTWQCPFALAATDLVWMRSDTHVSTIAENGGNRAGTKSKISVTT